MRRKRPGGVSPGRSQGDRRPRLEVIVVVVVVMMVVMMVAGRRSQHPGPAQPDIAMLLVPAPIVMAVVMVVMVVMMMRVVLRLYQTRRLSGVLRVGDPQAFDGIGDRVEQFRIGSSRRDRRRVRRGQGGRGHEGRGRAHDCCSLAVHRTLHFG